MSVKNPDDLGAAAVPYLRVVGHLVYSYLWARMARVALDGEGPEKGTFYKAKLSTARFYFAKLLPETAFQIRSARAGSASLMELDAALFLACRSGTKKPRTSRAFSLAFSHAENARRRRRAN